MIDIKEYLLQQLGHTDWYGESNHDDKSLSNMERLDLLLTDVEEFRDELISRLEEHISYRHGNYSAEKLHNKAKAIRSRHIIKEYTDTDFEKYWEED